MLAAGPWAYVRFASDEVDTGLAIAARAWFYRRTFAEVEEARAEFAAGELDAARARLERLLAEHGDVQPAQLWTHAVGEAGRLLAEIWTAQRRPARGAEALTPLLQRLPLDYQTWWAKGRALLADGDFAGAADALREAFKLTLHHPGVLDDYVAALTEINRSADVAWAADQFERALVRGAPQILQKVGLPRPALERRVLAAVGIPVEHARFFRHRECAGARGPGQTLLFPAAMFEPWPDAWSGELVVQMRVEGVWDGFTVDAMQIERRDGRVETTTPRVATLHRAGSGVGAYAEIFTGVPGRDVKQVTLTWSCAEPKLSPVTQRSIEKARRNVASARRGEGG